MRSDDLRDVRSELSLPEQWSEEQTFHEVLYDWIGRAPWLAISFAAHLLLYFLLAAIPWQQFEPAQPVILTASLLIPPEEVFEEPEEEVVLDLPEQDVTEPVLQDSEVITEQPEDAQDEADDERAESPFDAEAFASVIGIGGAAGGGPGKLGGRQKGRERIGRNVERALVAGLDWLRDHQSDDGRWDPDDFPAECDLPPPYADGAGRDIHTVGVTGLALLAFLGFGDTLNQGEYSPVIQRGIRYLRSVQDRDSGEIGENPSLDGIYDHAIATLALCEALYGAPGPLLKRDAQRAVEYIARARNPYSAWRYAVPGDNTNDTSVTGWMVFALAAAKDAGLAVDSRGFEGSLAWFDEVTDPSTGRTGYTALGQGSSRPRHLVDSYPAAKTEAMTAVSVLCRLFCAESAGVDLYDSAGGDLRQRDLIERGVQRLVENLPQWDSADLSTVDMYYWYYGSYALFQLSDKHAKAWKDWEDALSEAVLPNQRTDLPCFQGSWDPVDAWGEEGGRVYSTALMVLCLEVYFRYGKVLGSR